MKTDAKRTIKLYPWYAGLSSDLIFYIAFSTIWLVNVKGFDAVQVTFLATVSGLAAIILQLPVLQIVKHLGPTSSIRLGALCLLICQVLLTTCSSYLGFIIAQIFFVLASLLNAMGPVILKNNLQQIHRSQDYAKIASSGCVIYATATMITALLVGALFSCWQYLPMILGIFSCLVCLVLSFFIKDIADKRTRATQRTVSIKTTFPKPLKSFVIILVFYALIYGAIMTLQTDGKLFIQSELSAQLNLDDATTVFGIVIFVSRVMRLICNLIYPKVYRRLRDKIIMLFPVSLLASIVVILLGFSLEIDFYLRIILMTFGYSILPSLRDPFRVYCQELCLRKFSKSTQADAMLYLATARQCGALILSAIASVILLYWPLEYVFLGFSLIILPATILAFRIKSSMFRS